MKKISKKENAAIYCDLLEVNSLFGAMWQSFEPMIFDDEAESAELEICNNNFRIVANEDFWKKCKHDRKIFVICHEMCHVIFGHWLINPNFDREWANISQDIVVNEYLSKYFDEKVIGKDTANINNVFKHKSDMVERRLDYVYYYDLLMKCRT
jgi:predicted metal-dependent peptidase